MADYKSMYHKMFEATTQAMEILKQAQQAAEERYMDDDGGIIPFINKE